MGLFNSIGTGVSDFLGLSGVDTNQQAYQETPEERSFMEELKANYRGERPSYAAALLNQNADKSFAQAQAAQASGRTANAGASQRYLQSLRQQQMSEVGQQAATIGAQEKAGYLGMAGSFLTGQKAATIKGAQAEAEAESDTLGRRQKFISGLAQGGAQVASAGMKP